VAGLLAAVLVVCALAYTRALDGEFQFDDEPFIQRNPAIKTLERFAQPEAWALPGRPLTTFTLALNYRAGGLVPFGYHLVNLLIHLATTGLAFLLARRALVACRVESPALSAVVVAGLFALHPIQTESARRTRLRLRSALRGRQVRQTGRPAGSAAEGWRCVVPGSGNFRPRETFWSGGGKMSDAMCVLGGGIEPPTRGFSGRGGAWPRPRDPLEKRRRRGGTEAALCQAEAEGGQLSLFLDSE